MRTHGEELGSFGGPKYFPVLTREGGEFKGVLTLRDVVKALHADPNVMTKSNVEAGGEAFADAWEGDDLAFTPYVASHASL